MTSSMPYYEFQVMNTTGLKWNADGKRGHRTTLSMSVENPEYWKFEREKDEPLWSFYILSDTGEKLYLSYDENNNKITLEYSDEGGKNRFFHILIQDDGNYLFRAQHNEDRYLGWIEENGHHKHKMFTTKQPSENMNWLVKRNFLLMGSGKSVWGAQVQYGSKMWISQNATTGNTVKVAQSGVGGFILARDGSNWTFSPSSNSELSCSSRSGVDEILFEKSAVRSRTFKRNSGLVKNSSTGKWLAASSGVLCQVKNMKNATHWTFELTSFKIAENNETQFFPCLSY